MTRNASGKDLQVKSDLSRYLDAVVVAFDDPDDDDDKDGTGGSGDGTDDNEGGEGEGGSGAPATGDIKNPDLKRLSDEAAKHRTRMQAEKARADAAEAELRKLTDKDKSELEKAQRDLQEVQSDRDKWKQVASEQGLKLAFYESGVASMFKDQKVARRLMDIDDLTPDDEGNYDEKEIKSRAEALLKASPYLAADGSDDGQGEEKPGQSPNNGRRKSSKDSDKKLLEKFPALASRV